MDPKTKSIGTGTEKEATVIYHADRGENFKHCIENALSLCTQITADAIQYLLSEPCLQRYQVAFTHPSCGLEECYEYYEFIGDSVVNKCVMYYLSQKYKQMTSKRSIKILARIKVEYVSKKWLAHFSETLDFKSFISTDEKIRKIVQTKDGPQVMLPKSVLEDVFEAFIGVTEQLLDNKYEHNVGYYICQNFMNVILTHFVISMEYNSLFDAKTRLKELFDVLKVKQPTYTFADYMKKDDNQASFFSVSCSFQLNGVNIVIGKGTGCQKKEAEEKASEKALYYLNDVYSTNRILTFNGIDYDIVINNNIHKTPPYHVPYDIWDRCRGRNH